MPHSRPAVRVTPVGSDALDRAGSDLANFPTALASCFRTFRSAVASRKQCMAWAGMEEAQNPPRSAGKLAALVMAFSPASAGPFSFHLASFQIDRVTNSKLDLLKSRPV